MMVDSSIRIPFYYTFLLCELLKKYSAINFVLLPFWLLILLAVCNKCALRNYSCNNHTISIRQITLSRHNFRRKIRSLLLEQNTLKCECTKMIIITSVQVVVLCWVFWFKAFWLAWSVFGEWNKNLRHTKSMFSSSCSWAAFYSPVSSSIRRSLSLTVAACRLRLTMHCTMSYYDV